MFKHKSPVVSLAFVSLVLWENKLILLSGVGKARLSVMDAAMQKTGLMQSDGNVSIDFMRPLQRPGVKLTLVE